MSKAQICFDQFMDTIDELYGSTGAWNAHVRRSSEIHVYGIHAFTNAPTRLGTVPEFLLAIGRITALVLGAAIDKSRLSIPAEGPELYTRKGYFSSNELYDLAREASSPELLNLLMRLHYDRLPRPLFEQSGYVKAFKIIRNLNEVAFSYASHSSIRVPDLTSLVVRVNEARKNMERHGDPLPDVEEFHEFLYGLTSSTSIICLSVAI